MIRDAEKIKTLRILILGGNGMLGHKLWQVCQQEFDTYATVRSSGDAVFRSLGIDLNRLVEQVSAENFDSVIAAVADTHPQVIVNCVGIVKQHHLGHDPITSLTVNALFPHRLSRLARASGARLIHISTDCVFSGRRGHYAEVDLPDPEDIYGRTKLLGEVSDAGCLTIRTSMIGRELNTAHGLVEWFLGPHAGPVFGYTRAFFSGLTTRTLAKVIARVIGDHPDLEGVWHVAGDPIDKFALLAMIRDRYKLEMDLVPNDQVVIDRSLDGSRFTQATGWSPPAWFEMIEELAGDFTPYGDIREHIAHR